VEYQYAPTECARFNNITHRDGNRAEQDDDLQMSKRIALSIGLAFVILAGILLLNKLLTLPK
jgi:hypothetical protein